MALAIPPILLNELESRVDLLLYIGRDQAKRGKSGFNRDFQLESVDSNGRRRIDDYQFLVDRGFVETTKLEPVSDVDHSVTFIQCQLTERGRRAYEQAEGHYKAMVEAMIPYLS